MDIYLLDSNTISYLLEGSSDIKNKLKASLTENAKILISAVVFYEIARGLYHKNAKKQLAMLETLSLRLHWCDVTKNTWDLAAHLWAKCRKQGKPTCDPKRLDVDALIAAQAIEYNATVVTNNVRHFKHFDDVDCETW